MPRLETASDEVHPCVQARRESPPLDQPDYWPDCWPEHSLDETQTLSVFARERWNTTGLWLEKGSRYRFEASGEWLDLTIRCAPSGPKPGFAFSKAGWLLSAPSNALQRHRRRKPGNGSAVVWGARRAAHLPWFSLVGVIANGRGADEKRGKVIPHETLAIGAGGTFSPAQSGYLYCYANDVWSRYGNNRGKVTLKVTRLSPGTA